MAGGKSRRMGSEKGLMPFRGVPMIEYAIAALKPHCDQIIISANSKFYDQYGYPVVTDEIADAGPMGGIWSCLKHSKNELNFVLSCDMPLVDARVVGGILAQLDDAEIFLPWHADGFFEPLCAVYRRSLLPVFEKFILRKNFKIQDLIAGVSSRKLETTPGSALEKEVFYNVNTQKQLLGLSDQKVVEEPPELPEIPNLLMIAGTGRKVGKTTFACLMIHSAAKQGDVVGIKISPHMHHQADGQKVVAQSEKYLIIEETNPETSKDSSRMLRAGASRVYYLQTSDRFIREPFQIILDLIPKKQAVVCESGALLNFAKPGKFVLIKREGQTAFKKGVSDLKYKADRWVTFDGEGFDCGVDQIYYRDSRWNITAP